MATEGRPSELTYLQLVEDAVEWLKESDQRIAENAPLGGWVNEYNNRMTYARIAAVHTWLACKDAGKAKVYFRLVGEIREAWLSYRGRPERMIMRISGGKVVTESEAGDYVLESNMTPETFRQNFKQLAGKAEVVDTPTGKGIAHSGFRVPDTESYAWKTAQAFECSIIGDDRELARRIAEMSHNVVDFRGTIPAERSYAKALRSVLLGDDSAAADELSAMSPDKKASPLMLQIGRAYAALLEGNDGAVRREFDAYLGLFRKQSKPVTRKFVAMGAPRETREIPPEFRLSLPGLAFCNLAAQRGMKLEVDEPFLPRQLLNC